MQGSNAGHTSLAQLLIAFAFAGDIATGLEFDDGVRACYMADSIAEEMGLAGDDRATVYYTALIKDLGCTCWTTEQAQFWQTDEIIARRELLFFGAGSSLSTYLGWMRRHVGDGRPLFSRLGTVLTVLRDTGSFFKEGYASASEVCVRISRRLGLPPAVQEAGASVAEHWDGKGEPKGLKGEAIPLAARIIMPLFLIVPVHRVGGRQAAMDLARKGRDNAFDPAVVDAFLRLAEREEFWEGCESGDIAGLALAREPSASFAAANEDIDTLALALADFIDLKSPSTAAHSRRVAGITTQIARLMRCSEDDVERFRLAALLHDLGTVAVPSRVLNKAPESMTPSEREVERLHPYHSERILQRVPAMAPLIPLVGSHHEHLDGSGYFRGLKGGDIPLGARIIAVANRLDELTHEGAMTPREPAEALQALEAEGSTIFDPAILGALAKCIAQTGQRQERPLWPAGLTDREVEVLRLAARGLTRKQIGDMLSISESTVRHHLEHIYTKTQTSTRVGATLFAVENNLIE